MPGPRFDPARRALLGAAVCAALGAVGRGGERDERFEELARKARDPRPDARRRAVRDLALLDREDAWRLVIAALADPEAEVADEAQLAVARIGDARLWRRLCGRDGLRADEPLVRQRVAEACGRAALPVEAEDLLRCVDRRDPELARLALGAVERRARDGGLAGDPARTARALAQELRARHAPAVRAAALCALAALAPEGAAAEVRAALADREAALRVAALELTAAADGAGALPALAAAAGDAAPAVRARAVAALGALGTPEALAALVERLEREPRPRVRQRALEELQRASGMRYRLDPRPWRRWLAELPPGWRAGARGEAAPPLDRTVAFAGLPIVSDRLCFLIDCSGSLWNERPGGGTRKDAVDARLREVLPALPEGTRFNLLPYTGAPFPWRPRLVEARRREVAEALRWFEGFRERGRGDFFGAARLALEDPEVDTLVVLTDGAPTGGVHWNLELLMPLLLDATRFRPAAFDSIVVDAPPRLRRRWSWLADRSGGRSIAVEL